MAQRTGSELKKKILRILDGERKGLSMDALAAALRIKRAERPRFLFTLGQLEKDGKILRGKKGKYTVSSEGCIRARMMSLSEGFGFARPEDGSADCFIAGRFLKDALPGDLVLIRLGPKDERGPQGEIVTVLEKGGRLFTGRLISEGRKRCAVAPDSYIRYALPIRKSGKEDIQGSAGDKVRFSVRFDRDGELFARIVSVYGSADSARVCADSIVDAAGIPSVFPFDVLEQAEALRETGIAAEDLEGRTDLREQTIFTIDGRDAKDLDDAISLEKTENGWNLGVHIADVSHYVRDNTALDREARNRGTSVYFADRVIPMLPEALSNGSCSLNAHEDKLTLSAMMTLNSNADCIDVKIQKTVIRSCVRGVYSEINELFDGTADADVKEKYAGVSDVLMQMRDLATKMRRKASERGTMDLISTESRFVLDEEGHPVDIVARTTGESEGMIEQFMIAANVAVAAFARKKGIPFVYRVHEQPDPEKLRILSDTARLLGMKTVRLSAQLDMRDLMEEARETPYARLISDRLLRSMAKAKYSENPLGHYGLALKDYCHFTSPIRRYPDLSIHRILTDVIQGVPKQEILKRYTRFVQESSDLSSQFELRAMTAERECEGCYKAEYMSRFVGEEFEGIIASVSSFGLFVELSNSVDGLVRLEELPESGLRYNEIASLTDFRGRPFYTVGDKMTVRVESTDVSTGQIRFSPVSAQK